jgi:flavin-dependent dehydrogenase
VPRRGPGYQGDGLQVVGPDGTVIAQSPAPPPGDLPAAGNGIQRRELCRILLNAADKAGARLFHGATVATIADGGDGKHPACAGHREAPPRAVLGPADVNGHRRAPACPR